ncbi:MAG: hypothetical protein F6K58_11985 [Symploca sp. SIO2E9]|nr:hypothetical protein [Symploca sp. SIO2E9]
MAIDPLSIETSPGRSLKTRGHGDTGTRGQIGWGFDPNQFYAPYRRWGI